MGLFSSISNYLTKAKSTAPTLSSFQYGGAKPTLQSTAPISSALSPNMSIGAPTSFKTQPIPQVTPNQYPYPIGPVQQFPSATGGSTGITAPKPTTGTPTMPSMSGSMTGSASREMTLPNGTKVQVDPSGNIVSGLGSTSQTTQFDQNSSQGGTSAPPAPSMSPEALKAIGLAESAYKRSLGISPEELSTQEDLDKLIESTKSAFLGTKGQAIPLEFITGQMKAIEERATGLAEPLERKLARLQAARTSSIESSKFALERADKAYENESKRSTEARAEAESARRFGITTGLTQAEQAQKKLEADRKFEQDKQQFGLEYALKQRELAMKESTASTAAGAGGASELKTNALTSAQGLLKKFQSGEGTSAVGKSGFLGSFGYGLIPGTQREDFKIQHNNLKSLLSLEGVKYLKGQGQITEGERDLLSKAVAKLELSQSESEYENALKDIVTTLGGGSSQPQQMKLPNGTIVTLQADGTYK